MADNINQTIEDLQTTLDGLSETFARCCSTEGQRIDEQESNGNVEVGPEQQFPDTETYLDAKCRVSNTIYDKVKAVIDKWNTDNVTDLFEIGFGAVSVVFTVLAFVGPPGWAIAEVAGVVMSIALLLVTKSVNFQDLSQALNEVHSDLVLALYGSVNTAAARKNFSDTLDTAPTTVGTIEHELIDLMLTNKLLNNLFSPRQDMIDYNSPNPVTCGENLWLVAQGFPTTQLDTNTITVNSAYGTLNPSVPLHHGTYVYIPGAIGDRLVTVSNLTGWTTNPYGPPTLADAGYINQAGVWTFQQGDPELFLVNVCVQSGQYLDVTSSTPFTITFTYGATC